jgi:hypothetical protein
LYPFVGPLAAAAAAKPCLPEHLFEHHRLTNSVPSPHTTILFSEFSISSLDLSPPPPNPTDWIIYFKANNTIHLLEKEFLYPFFGPLAAASAAKPCLPDHYFIFPKNPFI